MLQLAYFCAGVGYVVTATFLVAIAESMPELQGQGWLVWLIAGLSATPACWLWDVFSRRWGQWLALYLAYTLNSVSILMLIVNTSLASVMVSSVIYGVSFIGIVSMMLAMVGRAFPENPSRPMSRLTFSYGIAQMMAPAVVGYLADVEGNYTNGLWLTLVVMALGVLMLHLARRAKEREAEPALSP
ncbi:MFS transporter [Marinobacter adhaerens]|uniref:MFS transporter n=1 Tax=Marinobacter adhaerens TaxID=1033846 RepID=UPI0022269E71|nr:MFS transporter [Marinobacter adhaerens]